MKYINFIVGAVSWVPYFVPIVIEAKKRNIVSYFFLRKNPKEYANPYTSEHMTQIKKSVDKYDVIIKDIKEVINFPGLTFLMEGDVSGRSQRDYSSSGILSLNRTHLKVSFTFNADFIWQYERYQKLVDHVIFPGESYAQVYKKISSKNLYMGSPKFDIPIVTKDIYKKYKLNPKHKYLLFFYPKQKWIEQSPKLGKAHTYNKMKYLVDLFRKMDFKVIIKSREKDRVTRSMGDYYFEETELFPISSLELLHISELAIFFSSASIEECVMMSTPFIDFKVDHKFDRFAFLHHPSYSRIINNLSINLKELSKHVIDITGNNAKSFQETRYKHLFQNENLSGKILDYFEEEADKRYNDAVQLYSQIKLLKDKHSELTKKRSANVAPILQKIKEQEDNKNNSK